MFTTKKKMATKVCNLIIKIYFYLCKYIYLIFLYLCIIRTKYKTGVKVGLSS